MCSSDLADRVEVEPFDGLLGGDDLVVAMAPAEAQQIVAQRLRQVAQVAVGVAAEGAVALRQLGPVGPVGLRNVGERSEERRGGKVSAGTCKARWVPEL